jgi:septin family protein
MKKTAFIPVLLTAIISSTQAATYEVFKCQLASGKIVYQSLPCPKTAVKQKVVEIEKMDPRKAAEARQQLATWQAEYAAREAAAIQAKKERQQELDRQEAVNALKRSALAQEKLAETANQPPVLINPVIGFPRYHRHGHNHDHHYPSYPTKSPRYTPYQAQ